MGNHFSSRWQRKAIRAHLHRHPHGALDECVLASMADQPAFENLKITKKRNEYRDVLRRRFRELRVQLHVRTDGDRHYLTEEGTQCLTENGTKRYDSPYGYRCDMC